MSHTAMYLVCMLIGSVVSLRVEFNGITYGLMAEILMSIILQNAVVYVFVKRALALPLETTENKAISVVSKRTPGVSLRRVHVKTLIGRSRKRLPWVQYVHSILLAEFERFSAAGVKITADLLREIALHTLSDPDSPFQGSLLDEYTHRPIASHITRRWIYSYLNRLNIVIRKQSVNLRRSDEHTAYTEKQISYHLGQLQRDFDCGAYDNVRVENMDETHFFYNMDNHYSLAYMGTEKVSYADVVSGGEGVSVVLRITGEDDPVVAAPFVIFRNRNRSYPIANVPDDVEGVSYRSQPRGWMDREMFDAWLKEPKAISKDSVGRHRVLFLDNCSGHTMASDQSLAATDTELKFLPANATHLCQPLDSFIIQQFKSVWRKEWESEKLLRIESGDWSPELGKLKNPGKRYYLTLASKCAEKLNSMKDSKGISLVRKSMIRCGLARDTDGTWKVGQLHSHLQKIVETHQIEFCGVIPQR